MASKEKEAVQHAVTILNIAVGRLKEEAAFLKEVRAAVDLLSRYATDLRHQVAHLKTGLDQATETAAVCRKRADDAEVALVKANEELARQKRLHEQEVFRLKNAPRNPQADLHRLVNGINSGRYDHVKDPEDRVGQLERLVERHLGDFVPLVMQKDVDFIQLHQDAFAAGYHADEYTLLGMMVKYAGLHGKEVRIMGKNGETIRK